MIGSAIRRLSGCRLAALPEETLLGATPPLPLGIRHRGLAGRRPATARTVLSDLGRHDGADADVVAHDFHGGEVIALEIVRDRFGLIAVVDDEIV